jgi:3-hydroxy-D-aspartate aldolase
MAIRIPSVQKDTPLAADAHSNLHVHLLGKPRSRYELNTPVLLVDIDALERNISSMSSWANAQHTKLRPHAKTHKSVAVAQRQLAAGALGICCAKLGEAEVMANGGITALHITSPVIAAPAIKRLISLRARVADLMVVVDHPDNVAALASAAAAADTTLQLIIDIDPGMHRTGVATARDAVQLARVIRAQPSLHYGGVQFYCGAEQHISGFDARAQAVGDLTQYLKSVIAVLQADGAAPAIVTGGGTGTHQIDATSGIFTDFQVGSYIFMDSQYLACEFADRGHPPFETSLFVDTRVISVNAYGLVTVDGGLKSFASEAGPPTIVSGAPEGSRYAFMGDEHGAVILPPGATPPRLGEVITFATPHCDPTVNLYDTYCVVSGDMLVDLWTIEARGRSQ